MVKRTDDSNEQGGSRKRSRLSHSSGGPRSGGIGGGTGVYVGNLAYETSWQNLKDHMRKAGNVDSAKVLSSDNGRSKGCGIVIYQHPKEAARAIRELHDSMLDGRKIFVREDRDSQRGSNDRDNAAGRGGGDSSQHQIYVGNLSYDTTWYDLKDLFRDKIGNVEHAEVIEGSDGRKKGFGIVKFTNVRDAEEAIRRVDGFEFKGRQIFVRFDNRASKDGPGPSSNDRREHESPTNTKVFVGNLSFDADWKDLKNLFIRSKVGHIQHAEVMEGPDGKKKGYGFVEFSDSRDADRAIRQLDGTEFQGRKIQVRLDRRATDGGPPASGRNTNPRGNEGDDEGTQLYVGNLSFDASWQDLKNYFNKVGHVKHADVIEGADGRKKGFGIVEFSKPRDASNAIRQLDGTEFLGRKIEVRMDRKPDMQVEKPEGKKRPEKKDAPKKEGKKPAEKKEEEPRDFQAALGSALKSSR